MKILYETKFLNLKVTDVTGEDWFYVKRPNAKNIAIIVPIIENKFILFLKTKRPPLIAENVAKFCIELPAGLVGDENPNETTNEAFSRELTEETGYKADKFEILAKNVASSSGLTDEICTIAKCYIEKDVQTQAPLDDGGIIADRIKVPIADIKKYLKKWQDENYAISAHTLGAIYLALSE